MSACRMLPDYAAVAIVVFLLILGGAIVYAVHQEVDRIRDDWRAR